VVLDGVPLEMTGTLTRFTETRTGSRRLEPEAQRMTWPGLWLDPFDLR
jgi:hypothetical protein